MLILMHTRTHTHIYIYICIHKQTCKEYCKFKHAVSLTQMETLYDIPSRRALSIDWRHVCGCIGIGWCPLRIPCQQQEQQTQTQEMAPRRWMHWSHSLGFALQIHPSMFFDNPAVIEIQMQITQRCGPWSFSKLRLQLCGSMSVCQPAVQGLL